LKGFYFGRVSWFILARDAFCSPGMTMFFLWHIGCEGSSFSYPHSALFMCQVYFWARYQFCISAICFINSFTQLLFEA